jgi:hypothetical protein
MPKDSIRNGKEKKENGRRKKKQAGLTFAAAVT